MSFRRSGGVPYAATLLTIAVALLPAHASAPAAESLSTAQIQERLERHDRIQTEELKHYQSLRHYQVEYTGFSTTIAARMDVEVNYDASSGKSFRIVSESGSKFLLEKVLKRAVESEKEASQDKGSTALTEANYRFHLMGSESLDGRPAYILDVDPLTPSKFLYRGKIWEIGRASCRERV